jgi:acid phosphatase type 7
VAGNPARSWRGGPHVVGLLTAALVGALAPTGSSAAPARERQASLSVVRVSNPPAALAPGARLRLQVAVRNADRRPVARAEVLYYLEAAGSRSRTRLGGDAVRRLAGRGSWRHDKLLRLPAKARDGSYRILVCAVRPGRGASGCRRSRNLRVATSAVRSNPAPGGGPIATPGGGSANAPAAAIALSQPARDSVLATSAPVFGGTAGAPSLVTATVHAGTSAAGAAVEQAVALPAPDGSFRAAAGSLADGSYTVTASQTDALGRSASDTRTFAIDTVAPALALTLTPAAPDGLNGYYTSTPDVSLSASDPHLTGVTCTVDGTTADEPASATIAVPGDGPHAISCTAADAAGNSTSKTQSFTVASVGPTVTLADPTDASLGGDATPTFDGTASASGTVTVTIRDGSGSAVQTLAATPSGGHWSVHAAALGDGSYTAQATQSDAAGNSGHSATHGFTVDASAPTLSLTLDPAAPNGSNGYYTRVPAISVSAGDPHLAQLACTVDGTTTDEPLSGTTSIAVSGDGSHSVSCTATDAVGNQTTSAKTFKVLSTRPTVTIADPAAGATTDSQTPTIDGSASGGSFAVTVAVYAGSAATGTPAQTLTATPDGTGNWSLVAPQLHAGTYTLVASQPNVAGNTGSSPARSFQTPALLVSAGDISGPGDSDAATAALIGAANPDVLAPLGDNAYESGSAYEYSSYYGPTWGQYLSITRPTPGNHDYETSGATGYFGYFGSAAATPGKGWYSYDLGSWHVVVLNSSDGCGTVSCASGSAQEQWLKADLAAHPGMCTLAYWHHPLFTSDGLDAVTNLTAAKPFWQDLYAARADVVLNGHAHLYERFDPQDPNGNLDTANGIREFTVGTGGDAEHPVAPNHQPNSAILDNQTFGVLELTLRPHGYTWRFVPISGQTFTDSGNASCHS